MQKRCPVGAGPSSNKCPRCESLLLERTSVRSMPKLRSDFSATFFFSIGLVKLGQPLPLSNLSSELKSGSPLTISTYMPARWLSQYSLFGRQFFLEILIGLLRVAVRICGWSAHRRWLRGRFFFLLRAGPVQKYQNPAQRYENNRAEDQHCAGRSLGALR